MLSHTLYATFILMYLYIPAVHFSAFMNCCMIKWLKLLLINSSRCFDLRALLQNTASALNDKYMESILLWECMIDR